MNRGNLCGFDNAGICVVTVTYGDRSKLLNEVVSAIFRSQCSEFISKLIVVNNASDEKTQEYLDRLQKLDPRVQLIHFPENTGSAGGFGAGLSAALKEGCNYIWLLDDDNVPEDNALLELLKAAEKDSTAAFLSLRTDRRTFIAYAKGRSRDECFGRKNSFLGFSWRDIPRKIWHGSNFRASASNASTPATPRVVPYAPYGGLLLKKEHVEQVGYPCTDFYLYADDNEFTYRLTEAGIPIQLVPTSCLADVDASWHVKTGRSSHFVSSYILLRVNAESLCRLYYMVRNQSYFEFNRLYKGSLEHRLNAALYLLVLLVLSVLGALLHGKKSPLHSYQTFVRAVRNGITGRLGKGTH